MKALAILIGLVFANISYSELSYSVTDLGTLGGSSSRAYAINSQGQVVGYAYDSSGVQRAFLYSEGTMTNIDTLNSFASVANDINNHGQIVGAVYPGDTSHAFLYSDGAMRDIYSVGNFVSANGINNKGQIVGEDGYTLQENDPLYLKYTYGDSWDLLSRAGPAKKILTSINDIGDITFYKSFQFQDTRPCVYFFTQNVAVTEIGDTLQNGYGVSNDVNNLGEVVGSVHGLLASCLQERAFVFVYKEDFARYYPSELNITDWGLASEALAINDSSQIVGWFQDNDLSQHAFLYDLYGENSVYDLNSLVGVDSGWIFIEASDINNNGQIVGYGINPLGEEHAFLLNPIVPEPSSFVLIMGGIILVFVFRRRR